MCAWLTIGNQCAPVERQHGGKIGSKVRHTGKCRYRAYPIGYVSVEGIQTNIHPVILSFFPIPNYFSKLSQWLKCLARVETLESQSSSAPQGVHGWL